jgi:phage baseplate assembly protein W
MANPIGISYPIKRGSNGYFEQSFDTKETIKDALANLILTPKNTRPGRPEYGSSLYGYLFEQVTDESVIQEVLKEDIRKWIPSIDIISIKTSDDVEFSNAIALNIVYKLKNSPESDNLALTVTF